MEGTAEQWASWLQSRLDERGWKQADLVRASDGIIKRDRVSKWLRGMEGPSYRLSIIVANSLGVPQLDALHAAGFSEYAEGQNGDPIALGRAEHISRTLFDIEAQLPRAVLIERLSQYTDSELLDELMRRNTKRIDGES